MTDDSPQEVRLIAWALRGDGPHFIVQDRRGAYYVIPLQIGARLTEPLDANALKQLRAELDADPATRYIVNFTGSQFVTLAELAGLIGEPRDGLSDDEIASLALLGGRPRILG